MSTPTRLFWVRCSYDFISKSPTDLPFRSGDLLYVTDVTDTNWWVAFNIKGNSGQIPSNYVSVLPQYTESTIQANETIRGIAVEAHESSSQAIIVEVVSECGEEENEDKDGRIDTEKSAGMGLIDNLDDPKFTQFDNRFKGEQPPEDKTKTLTNVKTISQVSQFTRELSKIFPEAGLPLRIESSPDWTSLLLSIHNFNQHKSAPFIHFLFNEIIKFPSLNNLLFLWLFPASKQNATSSANKITFGKSVLPMRPENMGIEAVVLHEWEGNKANGELCDLEVGDRVIVVHEQNDWVYCRRSPESVEVGYVPMGYLQKIVNKDRTGSDSSDSVPPLPLHIMKGGKTAADNGTTIDDDSGKGGESIDEIKEFGLETTEAFDELLSTGMVVEIKQTNPSDINSVMGGDSGGACCGIGFIGDKMVVTCDVSVMKWEPSNSIARVFSKTTSSTPLIFTTGADHVTPALDAGVRRLFKGQSATIVGCPAMCYGEAGLAGLVNAKSYIIYEIKVIEAVRVEDWYKTEENGRVGKKVPSGPAPLIARRVLNRSESFRKKLEEPRRKSIIVGGADDSSVTSSLSSSVNSSDVEELTTEELISRLSHEEMVGINTEDHVMTHSHANVKNAAPSVGGNTDGMKKSPPVAIDTTTTTTTTTTTPPPPSGTKKHPKSPSDDIMSPVSSKMMMMKGKGRGAKPGSFR